MKGKTEPSHMSYVPCILGDTQTTLKDAERLGPTRAHFLAVRIRHAILSLCVKYESETRPPQLLSDVLLECFVHL